MFLIKTIGKYFNGCFVIRLFIRFFLFSYTLYFDIVSSKSFHFASTEMFSVKTLIRGAMKLDIKQNIHYVTFYFIH